jgi:hypothetical protein
MRTATALLLLCTVGLAVAATACADDPDRTSSGGAGGTGLAAGAAGVGGGGAAGAWGIAGGPSGGSPPLADWCENGDTVLATAAQALPPRSWVTLPENPSLDALEMGYSLLYWNDSAVWDPSTLRIHWVGGPGTCCADPAQYKRISYDVQTDTWSIADTPFVGSGHAYDGNAFDPVGGYHFFALFGDREVNRFDGSAWDKLPELPWDAQVAVGQAWFPELQGGAGGLVYVNGSGRVAWYDGTSWTALTAAEADPWGSYNTFAEHDPVHGSMWMGAGNDGDRVHYRMDSSLAFTKLADAPISLNNGAALHSCDPQSGRYVVSNLDDYTWWEFDAQTDQWGQIQNMQGEPPNLEQGATFHVPIPDCGVILYFNHYSENRTVHLYRH